MKLTYSIEIHPGSPFQEEFAKGAMKAILKGVKQEFESKHQGNTFNFTEKIFVD